MESELAQILCQNCGYKFWIIDKWYEGCRDNDIEEIQCPKCHNRLQISVNGVWDYYEEIQKELEEYGFRFPKFNAPAFNGRDKYTGEIEMPSIKDKAKDYTSPETKNIAELDKVSVDIDITEVTRTKSDGEEFKLNVINVDGEEFRVPNSVLKQLQVQLEEKPDAKEFKVKKAGSGLNTEYTVILL